MNDREIKPAAGDTPPSTRAERLSGALRANLKRRKAQASERARGIAGGPRSEPATSPTGASNDDAAAHDSAEFVAENTRGRDGQE